VPQVGKCSNGRAGGDEGVGSPAGKLGAAALCGGGRPISAHGLQGLSPLHYRAHAQQQQQQQQQQGLTPLSKSGLGRLALGPLSEEPCCDADEVSKGEVAGILLALKSGAEGACPGGGEGEEEAAVGCCEGGSSQEEEGGSEGGRLGAPAPRPRPSPIWTTPKAPPAAAARSAIAARPAPLPGPRCLAPRLPTCPPARPPAAAAGAADPQKRSGRPRRTPLRLAGGASPECADVAPDQGARHPQLGQLLLQQQQQQQGDQQYCGYRGGKRRREEGAAVEGVEGPWLSSWRLLPGGRERMAVTLQLGGASFSGVLQAADLDM
jgi:hypothetical protein